MSKESEESLLFSVSCLDCLETVSISVLRQDTQDTCGHTPKPHKKPPMEISILEAAKTLKIGRSTIYKKIESGELSRSHSGKLDTSELFRVFGSSGKTPKTQTRHTLKTPVDTLQNTHKTVEDSQTLSDLSNQLAHLQAENAQLKERLIETRETLQKAEDREQWQRGQIEKLTETVRLLEAPKELQQPRNWFSKFLFK